MSGALLALALILTVGVPLAALFASRPTDFMLLAGESFLLGAGAIALVLMALSLAGIPWSLLTLIAGAAAVVVGSLIVGRGRRVDIVWPRPRIADAGTLVLIAGYLRYATLAPSIETDYIIIWGLKARQFWLVHGIDWRFLETPINAVSAHTDYPLLLPLVFDSQALLTGSWPERWMGLITAAWGVAAVLIARAMLREEAGEHVAALATLALMPLLFSPYLGLAEAPLVAYGIAGLLFVRRGDAMRGAVYLGLAAFSKNEGMTLIVAVVLALLAARKGAMVLRLWPAFAIPAPWWILRAMHHLPSDLFNAGFFDRLWRNVQAPAPIVKVLAEHPVGQPLFWIGVTLACVVGWRRIASAERFLAVVVALQLLVLAGSYFITTRDLVWHVRWSWDRLVRQMMPAVALLALFATLPRVKREVTVRDEA